MFLMSPDHSTNFEIQTCYENEPKFNDVYSKNNLSKTKDGAYIINLDEHESIGTHWIALYVNAENVKYFDSFWVEYIKKNELIGNENVMTNNCRVQAYDSIMCQYVCIGFIDFILKGKSLLEYTTFFSPNDYEKNDKIILKYFQ